MRKVRELVVAGGVALGCVLAALSVVSAQEPVPVETLAQAPVAPAAPPAPAEVVAPAQTVPTPRAAGAGRGRASATPSVAPTDPAEPTLTPRELEDQALDREREALWSSSRPITRIGQDVVVPAGTAAREVVVIGGSATVDGRVAGDLVVILGTLTLGPAAIVDGDIVNVAGATTIAPGARARQDLVVVGGNLQAPEDFAPGGDQVVVGTTGMGERVSAILPWVTHGLFLGRPVVPSLGWMWGLLAAVFFVYLLVGLFFERAVRACAETLTAKPLSAFLSGLLVLLLTGPVIFILAVSVVGIVVIPFAWAALVIAWIVGKVGVSRSIGAQIVPETDPGHKLQAARSFAIGFALVLIAYMIPIVGLLAFVSVAVFGLGSAWMAMMAAWRRENPAKPKPPRPVVPPPPPVSPSPGDVGGSDSRLAAPAAEGDGPAATYAASTYAPHAFAEAAALLGMPKATLWQRAAAFGIDIVLVLFTYQITASTILREVLRDGPNAFFLILLVYHIVFWTLKGTTVGGIICNLRLVKTDGTAVGFSEALIRGLSSILSIVTFGVGCLWIAYDADRQAWHDRIAGTLVVRVPKNWPL